MLDKCRVSAKDRGWKPAGYTKDAGGRCLYGDDGKLSEHMESVQAVEDLQDQGKRILDPEALEAIGVKKQNVHVDKASTTHNSFA